MHAEGFWLLSCARRLVPSPFGEGGTKGPEGGPGGRGRRVEGFKGL